MLKIEDAVSETLLITLYMRYLASNRPDPIIRDESASRLVAEIDYDFSKFDHAERSIIGTAIRADYFDKLAADFIRRQPNPVIVVIGCGLDGRRGRTMCRFTNSTCPKSSPSAGNCCRRRQGKR